MAMLMVVRLQQDTLVCYTNTMEAAKPKDYAPDIPQMEQLQLSKNLMHGEDVGPISSATYRCWTLGGPESSVIFGQLADRPGILRFKD